MLLEKNIIRFILILSSCLILGANFNFQPDKKNNQDAVKIINDNNQNKDCEIFKYEPNNIKYNVSRFFYLNNNIFTKVSEGEIFLYKFLYRKKISVKNSLNINSALPFQSIYLIYYDSYGNKFAIENSSQTNAVKIINQKNDLILSEIYLRSQINLNMEELCIGKLDHNQFIDYFSILFISRFIVVFLCIFLIFYVLFNSRKLFTLLFCFIKKNYVLLLFFLIASYYFLLNGTDRLSSIKNLIILFFLFIFSTNLKLSFLVNNNKNYNNKIILILTLMIPILLRTNYELVSDFITAYIFAVILNTYFGSILNKIKLV